jgi:hypothetical protein
MPTNAATSGRFCLLAFAARRTSSPSCVFRRRGPTASPSDGQTVVELLPLSEVARDELLPAASIGANKHGAALEGSLIAELADNGGSVLADVGDSLLVVAEEMHPAAAPSSA